jgi:putative hydroxymethylpyrimidine transport system substrate-binding protein
VRHSAGFLLCLALVAAGCGSRSAENRFAASPSRHVSLTLDWTPNPDHVALFYAKQKGLFARAGLDVRMRAPSDPAAPLKLVAAGKTDLAISYEPELFFAGQQRLPVVAVAAVVPRPLDSVIVRRPGVRSAAALAGGSIGITGVPTDDAFLTTIMHRAGLDRSRLKVVHVGYNLVPALLSRKVDAILGGYRNVEGIELRQRGLDPSIIPVDRAGVPAYDELVLVASATRLRSEAAYATTVRRFVAALARGAAGARRDPTGALAATRAMTESSAKFLRASVPATLAVLGGSPCITRASWQSFSDWMRRSGLLKQAVPAARVMTTQYLPPSCTA